MKFYLIRNTKNTNLYCRHGFGWYTHDEGITVYTEEERKNLELPVDGKWVEFIEVYEHTN